MRIAIVLVGLPAEFNAGCEAEIARWPVNSLREIKRSLRMHHMPQIKAAMQAEQEAMARQAGSAENIEAITAFMEKRKPDFRGL